MEAKRHTTLKGFAECWNRCYRQPLFTFLTHLSGRRRLNKETGEKTVETDECLAQRIINDYPKLASEVSIAFDNMLVDFDGLFPSLATEYEML